MGSVRHGNFLGSCQPRPVGDPRISMDAARGTSGGHVASSKGRMAAVGRTGVRNRWSLKPVLRRGSFRKNTTSGAPLSCRTTHLERPLGRAGDVEYRVRLDEIGGRDAARSQRRSTRPAAATSALSKRCNAQSGAPAPPPPRLRARVRTLRRDVGESHVARTAPAGIVQSVRIRGLLAEAQDARAVHHDTVGA